MADHPVVPHGLRTATGTAELHVEPSALGITAPGWVALSMVVVIALMIWKKVPAMIAAMLDSRIAVIRGQLDHAATLRAEAERLLTDAAARDVASAGQAEAIVLRAEAEARKVLAEAHVEAIALVARRRAMAEDKIGAAERAAIADVRTRAADAATSAAMAIIAERHGVDADRPLVDRAIAGLTRPN